MSLHLKRIFLRYILCIQWNQQQRSLCQDYRVCTRLLQRWNTFQQGKYRTRKSLCLDCEYQLRSLQHCHYLVGLQTFLPKQPRKPCEKSPHCLVGKSQQSREHKPLRRWNTTPVGSLCRSLHLLGCSDLLRKLCTQWNQRDLSNRDSDRMEKRVSDGLIREHSSQATSNEQRATKARKATKSAAAVAIVARSGAQIRSTRVLTCSDPLRIHLCSHLCIHPSCSPPGFRP